MKGNLLNFPTDPKEYRARVVHGRKFQKDYSAHREIIRDLQYQKWQKERADRGEGQPIGSDNQR
jgi:hypothetical protein